MENAIRFYEPGGPEVMRWEKVSVGAPGPGEALVRHVAVGLNFADTYFRTGLYPAALPNGLGVEGAGIVEAIGPGRIKIDVNQRYALSDAVQAHREMEGRKTTGSSIFVV